MSLVLRWRVPDRALVTRWRGPDGLAEALAREPETPIAAVVGPPGPAGPPGTPLRINQSSPASTWILAHGLGHVPAVQVFLGAGEQVLADVEATTSTVTITHASPQSGFVLVY